MTRSLVVFMAVSAAAQTLAAATIEMDSGRGQRVFESESCIQCHSINGKGGRIAPDFLLVALQVPPLAPTRDGTNR